MGRILEGIRCFLLDLDGTIYLGDELLPGAAAFIAGLEERGLGYLFLTNNSSRDKGAYVQKLSALGIPVKGERVLTSGEATVAYLNGQKPGARVYLLGTPALAGELEAGGIEVVSGADRPDFVVLGFDTTLTYQKLWQACDLVREGVEYVATHPDFNCPLAGGRFMPDAGAIAAFIQAATAARPKVIGKPNREMVDAALARTGTGPGETAIVGDRLYTDIAMGRGAGLTSILVLSGETGENDLAEAPWQPDHVFSSLAELAGVLFGGGAL